MEVLRLWVLRENGNMVFVRWRKSTGGLAADLVAAVLLPDAPVTDRPVQRHLGPRPRPPGERLVSWSGIFARFVLIIMWVSRWICYF